MAKQAKSLNRVLLIISNIANKIIQNVESKS